MLPDSATQPALPPKMKVVFPFIAQPHQIPHSLPLAVALSMQPGFDVRLACTTQTQEAVLTELLSLYPEVTLPIDRLRVAPLLALHQRIRRVGVPHKRLTLITNRAYFSGFDAAVVPERTSLLLKRLSLPGLRIIGTEHGAGDRAYTYSEKIRDYDFVLFGGRKQEQRLLTEGLIRAGHYHAGCYAKFDLVARLAERRPRLFEQDRPIVLYNPHWEVGLSSWLPWGFEVLERLIESGDWNVIFAPHIRLFDTRRPRDEIRLNRLRRHRNLLIDIGSTRCIDMTYTNAADVYVGDVSSQVVEFLARPRPCVFLNAHRVDWRDSPDYRSWTLGPVLDDLAPLQPTLAGSRARAAEWHDAQRAYFNDSLSIPASPEGGCDFGVQAGALAIARFIETSVAGRAPH